MQQLLNNYLPQAQQLFQKHKIQKAYVFGSVLSDQFNNHSDIDFLVDVDESMDPVILGEHLWNLESELQLLYGREIDLITSRSLRNSHFKNEVNSSRQIIYG